MSGKAVSPPPPGSDAAIKRGCICPVMDNARGWGYHEEGVYIYTLGCPVHYVEEAEREYADTGER